MTERTDPDPTGRGPSVPGLSAFTISPAGLVLPHEE